MYQHHIQLRVDSPLSSDQALAWFKTVKEFSPEDVLFSYNHNGQNVAMEYGTSDEEVLHVYTIPLKRDITAPEAQFIVEAWDYVFDPDFDIEISNAYDANAMGEFQNSLEIDEDIVQQATNDINKWRHNRWVEESVQNGWRWGTYFNSKEKTHPAMRNWDDLTESHRRSQIIEKQEIYNWLKTNGIV